MVLSGGINPDANRHSQYLQTRTLTTWLRQALTPERVEVFFGAGNDETSRPGIADVALRTPDSRATRYVSGVIPGNRKASKAEVRSWLDSLERGPKLERLLLFVSDHGEEGAINLWGDSPEDVLQVAELSARLARIRPEKAVYVMSQCYSGGFHALAVSSAGGYPAANPAVCGFTAAMPDTLASGCTSDVEGDRYQGYERYFTEELTGLDVVTGEARERPRRSIRNAHLSARLRDATIDLPLASSEYFLLQWALLLDAPSFKARAASSATGGSDDFQALRDFRAEARQAIESAEAHIARLERSTDPRVQVEARLSRLNATFWRERYDTLMPAWKARIELGAVPGFTAEDLEQFEPVFLATETDPDLARAGETLELILNTRVRMKRESYALASPERARFGRHESSRLERILEWASRENSPPVRASAKTVRDCLEQMKVDADHLDRLEKTEALRKRVELIRTELRASDAIERMNDAQALRDFRELRRCEGEEL